MKRSARNVVSPSAENSLAEIRKLTRIVATQVAVDRLMKLATTNKQKAIWRLCDGSVTREVIASKVNVSKRAVSYFVEECKIYGLLEEEKEKGGHPKRVIDYVPYEWREKKPSEEQKQEPASNEAIEPR
jgi:hypothetical protein